MGMISKRWQILLYTDKLTYPSLVLNFKILSQVVPKKSMTENFHMHYILLGMRDGKKWNTS